MPTTLTADAIEQSTYVITASFTDEDGAAVTPNAGLKWHLTDKNGTHINSRQDVTITPASTITILLKGADLAIDEDKTTRYLTIEGTYDSSLGSALPIKEQVQFDIIGLKAIP